MLDLKFIKENIDDRAPKSTPVIPLTYRFWEDMFLSWCLNNNKNVADFDLEVWKSYARTKKSSEVSNNERPVSAHSNKRGSYLNESPVFSATT